MVNDSVLFHHRGLRFNSWPGTKILLMPGNVAKNVIKIFCLKKRKDQQREVGQHEGSRRTQRRGSTEKGRKGRNRMRQKTDCFFRSCLTRGIPISCSLPWKHCTDFTSIYFKLTRSGTKATLSEAPLPPDRRSTLAVPRTPGSSYFFHKEETCEL